MTKREIPFTSSLGKWPAVLVLLWLPIHIIGLPWLLYGVFGVSDEVMLNFVTYAIGAAYMVVVGFRFLRRDFDVLWEHPGRVILQVIGCYGAMLLMNMALSLLLNLFIDAAQNPNNEALMDMVGSEYGKMSATAIFLAPIVEEMIFRAGIFGALRRRSRVLAYVLSMAVFSIYHVWGYAISDPMCWFYLLQYIPAAWLLCRCYEYCDSIWGSVFFHMLTNYVSIQALSLLEDLL